jgi:tetraacyldisaccharide 4'-kinase
MTDDEITEILSTAGSQDLEIVTTAKDAVRLVGHHGPAEELLDKSRVIEVEMAFDSPATPGWIIEQAFVAARKRGARKNI